MIFYAIMAQVFAALLALVPLIPAASLPAVGEALRPVVIQGNEGGRTDGTPFRSVDLLGKVAVYYYVDPDERGLNDSLYEALKRENFSPDQSQSVAVINMAATVMPDFLLATMLKRKQKQYPRTIYVKDQANVLVREWGLLDNSSCVTVTDAQGRLVYSHCGKLLQPDIDECIRAIRGAISRNSAQKAR